MSAQVQATMTLITWGVLMALYALNKYVIKHNFLKSPILVDLSAVPISRPGSFIAGAGVVFTFVSNIAAIGVVFGCALAPSHLFPVHRRLALTIRHSGMGSDLCARQS